MLKSIIYKIAFFMCLFGRKNKIDIYGTCGFPRYHLPKPGELVDNDYPFVITSSKDFNLSYEKNIDNRITFDDTIDEAFGGDYDINFIYIKKDT